MKTNIDKMVTGVFPDELLNIEPENVDTDRITNRVFEKLSLEREVPQLTVLETKNSKRAPKRKIWKMTLVAAVLVVVAGTGVFAANELLKLSNNDIGYFESTPEDPQAAASENSHEVTEPLFHKGMAVDLEQFNTPVGETVTDSGITMTLDTVAMDDNFASLFFTIDYGKPIDFETIYPDEYPGNGGESPEYSKLIYSFAPSMWLSVNKEISVDGGNIWMESQDAYFINDQTIKMSARYILPEDYDDQLMLHIGAYHMMDADGVEHAGQGKEHNAFSFSVAIDKSSSSQYTKEVEPGKHTFMLDRYESIDGDAETFETKLVKKEETLDIKRLKWSPFGATLTLGFDYPAPGEPGYEELIAPDSIPEEKGVQFSDLYMEDNEGNVLRVYHDPVNGYAMYVPEATEEILGISPTAESITVMPFTIDDEKAETRTYNLKDIIGQKIETNSKGGYIVENYTVSGKTVEFTLRPYGMPEMYGFGRDFILADDNITLAGGRSGLIREEYNRETALITYAVDYYAATEEELKAIETVETTYNGELITDPSQAITLELKSVK